jgi:hypothetical protein
MCPPQDETGKGDASHARLVNKDFASVFERDSASIGCLSLRSVARTCALADSGKPLAVLDHLCGCGVLVASQDWTEAKKGRTPGAPLMRA